MLIRRDNKEEIYLIKDFLRYWDMKRESRDKIRTAPQDNKPEVISEKWHYAIED